MNTEDINLADFLNTIAALSGLDTNPPNIIFPDR